MSAPTDPTDSSDADLAGQRPAPRFSFVVPAHEESASIANTVRTLVGLAGQLDRPFEVVVVDDASSDGTGALAAAAGARVVRVEHRQIAATRNSGVRAAAASSAAIVFVDADTRPGADVVRAALAALDNGAIGGGAFMRFDAAPWYGHVLIWCVCRGLALWNKCGGAFLFVRRDAFERVGGFDEELFVSEEIDLAAKLRRLGPFRVLRGQRVVTSGRKLSQFTFAELVAQAWRLVRGGPRSLKRRDGLDMWYERR